jgi:ATP-dependent DNA helicase RecQ
MNSLAHNKNLILDIEQRSLSILQSVFGYNSFRSSQHEIVNHIALGGDALVLMPTGGGKSLCYQIPALIRDGLAIVVSPLVALMQDQVDALLELGIEAACLHANTPYEHAKHISNRAYQQQLKILYVAPERIITPRFLNFLQSLPHIALFAIDEAHCVSHWGHDFRPEYQNLGNIRELFPKIPIIALTATADEATRSDILNSLHLHQARVFLNSFNRGNIFYRVIEKNNAKEQLLQFIRQEQHGHSGIVYCLSRKKVEDIASWLSTQDIPALPYHAGLDAHVRERNQRRFLREEGLIMVATIAFGMGINKPDVRFVAHIDLPKSPENFYQESGRAGRDGLPAVSWMCYGLTDVVQLARMIQEGDHQNPQQKIVELHKLDAMLAFCETGGCRRQHILSYFNESIAACGDCDNCRHPPKMNDETLAAQQLFSVIYRTGQRFAAGHIIDVLIGKVTETVRQWNHHELSVFGIGKNHTIKTWRSIIRQLISMQLLQVDVMHYQRILLKEGVRDVLQNKRRIFIKHYDHHVRQHLPSHSSRWLRTEREERLWQALRKWRRDTAEKNRVPVYAILHDQSLEELVKSQPKKVQDLSKITGIGEIKRARYGHVLMELLQQHRV